MTSQLLCASRVPNSGECFFCIDPALVIAPLLCATHCCRSFGHQSSVSSRSLHLWGGEGRHIIINVINKFYDMLEELQKKESVEQGWGAGKSRAVGKELMEKADSEAKDGRKGGWHQEDVWRKNIPDRRTAKAKVMS